MPVGQESPWRGMGVCAVAVVVAINKTKHNRGLYIVISPDWCVGSMQK